MRAALVPAALAGLALIGLPDASAKRWDNPVQKLPDAVKPWQGQKPKPLKLAKPLKHDWNGRRGNSKKAQLPELPKAQVAPEDHLRRVFADWVVEVSHSANLVVLRTPPGSAHVVASALDRAGLPDILGTVAGDDTLIVVAAEEAGGAHIAGRLADLAGL